MMDHLVGIEAKEGGLRIRLRLALLEPEGPFIREIDLEIREGVTVKRLFKGADRSLGLKRRVFEQTLKGKLKATVLLNGNRLDPDRVGDTVLRPDDEISLLSGLAGG